MIPAMTTAIAVLRKMLVGGRVSAGMGCALPAPTTPDSLLWESPGFYPMLPPAKPALTHRARVASGTFALLLSLPVRAPTSGRSRPAPDGGCPGSYGHPRR